MKKRVETEQTNEKQRRENYQLRQEKTKLYVEKEQVLTELKRVTQQYEHLQGNMKKAQHHLADCFQKLHMTYQNAWYYTYNCTNDWEALKKQVAADEKKEISLKVEAEAKPAEKKHPK